MLKPEKFRQGRRAVLFAAALFSIIPLAVTAEESTSDGDTVVVTVNGRGISQTELLLFAHSENRSVDLADPQAQALLIQEYIGRELFSQDAVARKMDKLAMVKLSIENQRRRVLADAVIAQLLIDTPVSEDQITTFYRDKFVNRGKEYKTSNILVDSEKRAKAIIAELDGGADFTLLANRSAADSEAVNGGALEWMRLTSMPESYAKAVLATKVGAYHNSAVQTKFGWHVIKVDETRKIEPPPLQSIRAQIVTALQQEQVMAYHSKLFEKAKIEVAGETE